jgi:hypothetical protein
MGLRTLIQVFHEHEGVPPKYGAPKYGALSSLFYNNKNN